MSERGIGDETKEIRGSGSGSGRIDNKRSVTGERREEGKKSMRRGFDWRMEKGRSSGSESWSDWEDWNNWSEGEVESREKVCYKRQGEYMNENNGKWQKREVEDKSGMNEYWNSKRGTSGNYSRGRGIFGIKGENNMDYGGKNGNNAWERNDQPSGSASGYGSRQYRYEGMNESGYENRRYDGRGMDGNRGRGEQMQREGGRRSWRNGRKI